MAVQTSKYAMLVDHTLCVGCEACTVSCKEAYGSSRGIFRTKISEIEEGSFPNVLSLFLKKSCMHCNEAVCTVVCPTGACHKTADGLVVINKSTCIGCNYCAGNCPFQSPQFDQANGYVEKCSLCSSRVEAGLKPLCAEVCTTRAIRFGDRDEMLEVARQRVADLHDQNISQANLYGERELRGMSVLFVLGEAPGAYGLPQDPQLPVGAQVWKRLVSPFGGVVAVAGVAALLLNALQSRKMQVKKSETQSKS